MNKFGASDGASLAYEVHGEGPILVCLAGLTRNSADFEYVLPFLTGVTAITMDYRGRGQSDWTGGETYSIEREAKDVIELMGHLGINQFAVLGTSRGGIIGMVLAATLPDRVRGLMMNDIGPVIERAGLEAIQDYIDRPPRAKTFEDVAKDIARHSLGFEDVDEERWVSEAKKRFVEVDDGLALNYDPELRVLFDAAMAAPAADLWPLFAAIGPIPLGVIRAANSNLLSTDTLVKMNELRPDLISAEVPNRGHVPFLDEPEARAAIATFLEKIL